MKPIPSIACLALIFCALSCSDNHQKEQPQSLYQSIDTVPMLIMQIQQCAKLHTAEYHIHKIITHDDVVQFKGNLLHQNFNIKLPLGQRKVAIPMDATLKAYIDFSTFSTENVERQNEKITIILPDPKVELTSSKVNQKEIRTFVGLARAGFSDEELTLYEQQGREAILQSISSMGIIEMARENAARTLIPMLEQMGFKESDITIAFRKDITIQRQTN